jgi:hypothetical protein
MTTSIQKERFHPLQGILSRYGRVALPVVSSSEAGLELMVALRMTAGRARRGFSRQDKQRAQKCGRKGDAVHGNPSGDGNVVRWRTVISSPPPSMLADKARLATGPKHWPAGPTFTDAGLPRVALWSSAATARGAHEMKSSP